MWNLHVMANCECLHVGLSDFSEPCRKPTITARKQSLGQGNIFCSGGEVTRVCVWLCPVGVSWGVSGGGVSRGDVVDTPRPRGRHPSPGPRGRHSHVPEIMNEKNSS